MKNVPAPCREPKNIIAFPSQIWYLTEASNWMPSKRNTDIPLSTGRRRRARQASDNKPQRVAILNSLYCHLKPEWKRRTSEREVENSMEIDEGQYRNWAGASPEIVEIGEESKTMVGSRDVGGSDVYVAVGKNDLHVVKWALDHVVSPGSRVFLVHVFPPIAYIPTPVGRLSRSQLSKDQVQVYISEECNKRKHLLEKYIRLCNESKVVVDTMLVESNASTKAILELIPVANITTLVMGAKQSPFSRLSRKGLAKGEYVQKYAPEYCEVTVVYDGKKMSKDQQPESKDEVSKSKPVSNQTPQVSRNAERHFFECVCFSGKFD